MPLGRLHYKNYQYITNTCDCVLSLQYFAWVFVCFPIVVNALLYIFDSYIQRFPCVVNVPLSHVPVLLAMQWSVAWRSAFYRGREHLWIVFSFKRRVSKLESWLMQSIKCVLRRNLRQSFSSSPSEQSRSLSHRQLLWIHIPSPHWYWLAPQVVGESAKVNIATSQLVFYCKYTMQ